MILGGMGVAGWAWLLVVIPLAVAAALLLLGRLADRWGHWLGVAGVAAPFALAVAILSQLIGNQPSGQGSAFVVKWFTWLQIGSVPIEAALRVDHLSILFALLVTGVGSLIFIYAVAYMADDPGRRRFFGQLNLFAASMLLLVLADNYALLFVGWEGVGLASYLLIGFWQAKPSAGVAAKKAFLMNRIGDLGLLSAMALMMTNAGSLAFPAVDSYLMDYPPVWKIAVGLLLLLAACGKSAQFPLQGWLTDAMEGPTPVSALIHAATMVTAGVYLMVRSHGFITVSLISLLTVAIVGAITILIGAWIGAAKRDIKQVLAGSTMSQIGYMILSACLGPMGAVLAIFHLLTHGAFKANLFLGAGAVMHATGDQTNMEKFGGLRRLMPWTALAFACSTLAIIGFPPTAGFYSKEHIIALAFSWSPVLGVVTVLGALVTAFYMTRLVQLTFFGQSRLPKKVKPHEAPALMIWPMIVLAIASLGLGVWLNRVIFGWLISSLGYGVVVDPEQGSWIHFDTISIVALSALAVGVLAGWLVYRRGPRAETNLLQQAGRAELGADIAGGWLVRGSLVIADGVAWVDRVLVDGGINLLVRAGLGLSALLRRMQTGKVRSYGLVMALGVCAFLVLALIMSAVI